MEHLACLKGIQSVIRHPRVDVLKRICLFTDSQYVATNVDNAKFVWPARQWRTKAGTPVLNAKLWKDLIKEIKRAACRVDTSPRSR